ncbi:ABC transporter substrate-binding protein [Labrys wisconsinensis]|uniref:Peptide/nickel transport system substrate-binding protein n=1 Tax=Labrys wisconsinensis TaxID=425677 RepID=A0ABU0JBQ2_9HYPH|nr:ABC transporter substrate-binding protein [Labrys wisconsinensis]MDQ0471699.1 peptide/nickel transport system substrate-binding protein [Labrys wisconsinensis]
MSLRTMTSAFALCAALLGAAVGAPARAEEAVITGGFDVGPGGFQGNFNPLAATAGFTWLSLYFEPLVAYDDKLETIVGVLADRFETSPDQLAYTFHLADAKWHDGQPFTAKDAKFTIELAKQGTSGTVFAARLAAIAAVETPDERTVVLKLSKPSSGLLDVLTKVMMLPQHALAGIAPDALAKNAWWSTTPIGTGPFKFGRYVTDQYVELAANPDYRGGKPAVSRIINRYFGNTAAAVAALRAGEIQFSYVDADDVPTLTDAGSFRVIEGNSYVVNYLGFNQELPLWKDLRVRQAVMHAIDRNAIIQSLYKGAAAPANCGYVAERLVPADADPYAYDPDKARQLLQEAGWDKLNGDKPITVLTYYNTPLATNVLAAIQAMLGQVGINVVPRAVDTPTYNGTIMAAKPDPAQFPLVYAGLQNGPDPSNLNVGLNEKQIPPAGANFLHIRMPEVSAAFDAALAETDEAKRADRYRDVCKAMNAQLPWATLWVAKRYGVASTKLKNFVWTPAPGGGPYQAHPETWAVGQ